MNPQPETSQGGDGATAESHPREAGAPASNVLARLMREGCKFDFFEAVWLLERCRTNRTPVGGRGPVAREVIRFRPDALMAFPASDVQRIERRDVPHGSDFYYLIEDTFLGLYGVSTPLPLYYAVDILRSVAQAEGAPAQAESVSGLKLPPPPPDERETRATSATPQRDFLDLLHHRLTSLFYRAWLKYRFDKSFGMPDRDSITEYLLLLIGAQPGWGRDLLGVAPIRLLRYAGALTQHPRSAVTLEGVLFDYWKGRVPIRIEQFLGRWTALALQDLNAIGMMNCRLGEDLTVGEEVYDLSGAFKVVIGPVDWDTYTTFLPDGRRFAETCSLIRLYCMDPLALTLEVQLYPDVVPQMQLSSDDGTSRLGYTSWPRAGRLEEASVTFDATYHFDHQASVEAHAEQFAESEQVRK